MQLTQYTDISLRVLMHLALEPESMGTVRDIAQRYNLSRNHLVKVVHQLVKQGYLRSTQGRAGGIQLARQPSQIWVGDVVRAMESTTRLVDCVGSVCPIRSVCVLRGVLDEASDAFFAALDRYSLSDLTRNRNQLLQLVS
ncbi:MAG: Rrf2 family transcriptional regulator [Gammaproteobacteria bacterium]|nr:Rrf2 family transcriptional regulator [Gammaproteobacteria bacterium]